MEYTPNQLSKFKTKDWLEINDDASGMYNTNSQIKFNISTLKSILCDYSDMYILVSGGITVPNTGTAAAPDNRKSIIVKNCALFTGWISEINNTQIDIDVVMRMYNSIEYSDNYSRTSGSLWQCYREETFLDANGAIADFSADKNKSASFNFKTKIAGRLEIVL